jgi:hypothetical protein
VGIAIEGVAGGVRIESLKHWVIESIEDRKNINGGSWWILFAIFADFLRVLCG